MAYAETAILHDPIYTPAGPSTEYERRVRLVDGNASTTITVIRYDDVDPVPAASGADAKFEYERWNLSVAAQQVNKLEIRRQAEQAMATLQSQIDDANVTNAEAVAYLKHHARVLRRLIRLTVGLLEGTD